MLAGHDAVVLALPHGHSAGLAAQLPTTSSSSTAAPTSGCADDDAWTAFYDTPYAGSWPYGMPELPAAAATPARRPRRRHAHRGARAATRPPSRSPWPPALAAGVLEPDDITVVAASGTSGAGRSLKPHLLGAEVMGAMSPYGVGGVHRHTPEIEQNLTAAGAGPVTVSFTPTLAPMPRGILATCTARVRPGARRRTPCAPPGRRPTPTSRSSTSCPTGRWPSTGSVLGSNAVHLQVVLDERVGRVVVVAAVDNLTKGTAGAAVQCLNLALGLPETTGLPVAGVAP